MLGLFWAYRIHSNTRTNGIDPRRFLEDDPARRCGSHRDGSPMRGAVKGIRIRIIKRRSSKKLIIRFQQKCYKYFPDNEEIMTVGKIINVKCASEANLNDCIIRTLIVERVNIYQI